MPVVTVTLQNLSCG